jgi:hypothetical protein
MNWLGFGWRAAFLAKLTVTGSFPMTVTAKHSIGNTVKDYLELVGNSAMVPNVAGLTEAAAITAIKRRLGLGHGDECLQQYGVLRQCDQRDTPRINGCC